MVDYIKPWLSVDAQIEKLASRGVDVGGRDEEAALLRAVGYYRLTGYLYPFRRTEHYEDDESRTRIRARCQREKRPPGMLWPSRLESSICSEQLPSLSSRGSLEACP